MNIMVNRTSNINQSIDFGVIANAISLTYNANTEDVNDMHL